MSRSSKILLVPSRLIIDRTEYYWQNIVQIELQYGKSANGHSLFLLISGVALLWALTIGLGNYWLFLIASLATFPSLTLLKSKQQYDIVMYYRDKNGTIQAIRPLAVHGISLSEEEKQKLFIDMRKTYAERG